ncbi:MAG: glycosyltransferase [Pirellulales bacterium]|nr:glycosyltransferase [Pirellulales bacterium]
MPKLSIIIPVLGRIEALEQSLVSLLAIRPRSSEVLVVLNSPYADPYALTDEVRFISTAQGAGWVESVNVGLREATSPVVHIVSPGVEVADDWVWPALRYFSDRRIAAVSPVAVAAADPARVLALGVGYRSEGGRALVAGGSVAEHSERGAVVGCWPTAWAGFYRRDVLLDLAGGFDAAVGDDLADIDLALRLEAAGFDSVCEPLCHVTIPDVTTPTMSFRSGRSAERLYWRHRGAVGPSSSVARHMVLVARDALTCLIKPRAAAAMTGRITATLERGTYRRAREAAELLQQRASAMLNHEPLKILRFDEAHRAVRPPQSRSTVPGPAAASPTGSAGSRRLRMSA